MFITKLRADSGDRSPAGDFWFTPVAARTSAGVRVTSQSALALPAVWACGRVLSESFAVLPFMLYQPKPEGRGRTRVTRHWLERLMCRKPNRFQSPYEWRLMLQWHLALRGNAFCQITDDGRGGIDELLPLHPDRMSAEVLPGGNYRYRYMDENGREHYYTRGQIWHLRGVSNDGIVGLNPIEVEREAIGEAMAMQTYASRFYANDAKPGGGWIEHPGGFSSPAAKKVFRESWQEMQGGSNRGKVAVLERGMKFHELGLNNADAQFVEGRGLKVADICRIFRVPPHKIQDLQRSTNNNIEHQGIEFWNDTMRPYSSLWASSINCFLLGEDSDLQPVFDMSEVLMGDSQARSRYWSTMTTAGILTRNEGREAENYDPLDGLDEPLQPMNMGNAGANAVQPQDQGQPQNDARLMALAGAASDRVARKESQIVAATRHDREKMVAAYEKHAQFVSMALDVPPDHAAAYCAQQIAVFDERPGIDVDQFVSIARNRLERLALGAKPDPVNVGAVAMHRLAGAISAMPAPKVEVINNVDATSAGVSIHNEPAQVNLPPTQVNVAAPTITNEITVPQPQVSVNVPAADVVVHNHMPAIETPKPVVHNHIDVQPAPLHVQQQQPNQGGQQDRPYPTQTIIKKRDAQGRADVIETRPLDE